DLEALDGFLAFRAALVEPTSRQIVTLACIDEQEARAKRDLCRLERRAFEQQCVIALAQRRDRLIHYAAPHADVIVLGTKRDAGDLTGLEVGGQGLGDSNGERCRR